MATKPHKADPDNCRICAKLTMKLGHVEKCKRHGGMSHRTSWDGRMARRAAQVKASDRAAS